MNKSEEQEEDYFAPKITDPIFKGYLKSFQEYKTDKKEPWHEEEDEAPDFNNYIEKLKRRWFKYGYRSAIRDFEKFKNALSCVEVKDEQETERKESIGSQK